MDASIEAKVSAWQDNVTEPDLVIELDDLCREGNEEKLFDAFYRDLAFGTAGLRGTLGVGTNRMNVYVVAQATQGVADYLNAHYENPTLALARDSRNKGEDFQRVAAGVLAANGIHVYVYPRIEPVPTLSFAVRHLGTSAGIVLTACLRCATSAPPRASCSRPLTTRRPTTATRSTTTTAARSPTRPRPRSPRTSPRSTRLPSTSWTLRRASRRA